MEQDKKNRKSWALILGMVLLGAVIGILAYMTDSERTVNIQTIGNVTVHPDEDFEEPELKKGKNTFKKAVRVQNTGNSDSYVRVRLEFSEGNIEKVSGISQSQNGTYYSAVVDGIDEPVKDDSDNVIIQTSPYIDHLPDGWVYIPEDEDDELGGYYYYTSILPAKKSTNTVESTYTPYLCSHIMTWFENEDDVKPYDIYVYVEGVQIIDKDGAPFVETSQNAHDEWKLAWKEFTDRKEH